MSEDQFDQLVRSVYAAQSYPEIMSLTESPVVSFDQLVRLQDQTAKAFTHLLGEANDTSFARMIRQVKKDNPRWLKLIRLDDLVRQELDIRFLIAKLPRMGEEAVA